MAKIQNKDLNINKPSSVLNCKRLKIKINKKTCFKIYMKYVLFIFFQIQNILNVLCKFNLTWQWHNSYCRFFILYLKLVFFLPGLRTGHILEHFVDIFCMYVYFSIYILCKLKPLFMNNQKQNVNDYSLISKN